MMLNKINLIIIGTGNGAKKLYNGNIAQTFWKTGSNNKLRGYDYSYDSLNRLLRAEFYNSEVQPYTGAYNEIINYDLNGNITSLNRTTGDNSGAAVAMDELTYTYKDGNGNSNVLLNVSDAVSPQSTDGFIDGNTDPMLNDYEYDQNGNMILDRNKGITEIKYNHLNLPTRITWANNKYISYQYNAAGQKVRKTVDNNDGLKIVDYLDGFQYAGSVLQFFPTAEGYVKATRLDKSQTELSFNYIYNYTDHLGNVRLSYTLDPQAGTLKIVDENHYYPFGLRHEIHYPSSRNRDFRAAEGLGGGQVGEPVKLVNVTETEYMYKYNGFEYQNELGLGWYDYQARNYDPALGRWMNVDPLSEMSRKTSPYVYALNNPVYFIDPDGMMAEASSDKSGSDGANSDNYSGMTTGVKLAFGVSLDSVINSGAAVSFYGNLQSTGRKEAEAERFASNTDTGDPSEEKADNPCPKCPAFIKMALMHGGNTDLKANAKDAISLNEWVEIYNDKSFEEIINEEPKNMGMPGGPEKRYVINPYDSNVMDMRHVMVVGFMHGQLIGIMVERMQSALEGTRPSAFDAQDYYSNYLGAKYHSNRLSTIGMGKDRGRANFAQGFANWLYSSNKQLNK